MKEGDRCRYDGLNADIQGDDCEVASAPHGGEVYISRLGTTYHVHCSDLFLYPEAPARALRFNAGKPELFYPDMFPLALAEVARTLEYGTKRPENAYPRFNWCKGAPFLELYSCARRHMLAWMRGERHDADAKKQGFEINNLAFTIGNLMRLLEQELSGKTSLDDRYKSEVEL